MDTILASREAAKRAFCRIVRLEEQGHPRLKLGIDTGMNPLTYQRIALTLDPKAEIILAGCSAGYNFAAVKLWSQRLGGRVVRAPTGGVYVDSRGKFRVDGLKDPTDKSSWVSSTLRIAPDGKPRTSVRNTTPQ